MAITFACPNGHKLKVADSLAGKTVACPRCSAPSAVPSSVVDDTASPNLEGLLGASSLGLPDLTGGNAAASPLLGSEAPLDHSYVPGSVAGKRWHPLALGLKIHYAAAICFALGAVLFWIALGLPLLPAIGELFPLFSSLALISSAVSFACAALLQTPSAAICFAAPDGQARALLAASLATLAAMIPIALRMQRTSTTAERCKCCWESPPYRGPCGCCSCGGSQSSEAARRWPTMPFVSSVLGSWPSWRQPLP